MTSLVVVRHAEADPDAPAGVDPGLSDRGRVQAQALARRLAAMTAPRPDLLVVSPLRRASETAQAVARATGLPITVEPRLAEWRSGNDTMPAEAFQAAWNRLGVADRQHHRFAPGHETGREFAARVTAALDEVIAAHAGRAVVLVAHGGVAEVVFCHLLGLADGPFRRAYPAVGHASITHWRREASTGDWVLETSNDCHHLDAG